MQGTGDIVCITRRNDVLKMCCPSETKPPQTRFLLQCKQGLKMLRSRFITHVRIFHPRLPTAKRLRQTLRTMKFGVLQFFSWPGRRVPLATVYDRALDRIRIMDQGGYDAVWLAEHHFSTYSVCPSVHIMGMHAADITRNLRIGTGVSLAAFYHPLRLAEEVALLDNLSGGRVNWGAGRGFDATEMRVFGVERDESYDRFREKTSTSCRRPGRAIG